MTAARENAQQVREEISADMWEQVNRLYLRLKQVRTEGLWSARPHYLSRVVIEGVHLLSAEFPRSVRFAAARIESALQAIAHHTSRGAMPSPRAVRRRRVAEDERSGSPDVCTHRWTMARSQSVCATDAAVARLGVRGGPRAG